MQGGVRKRRSTWYYYFDIKTADNKRKKIERKGGTTKAAAQKALRKVLTEYEETGTFIENSKISVSDYLDFWYKEYVEINCKYNTQLYYRQVIDNHLKPYFSLYKLESITTSSINQFLNERFKMGYSSGSLKRFYAILSKSIRMAIHPYGYIKDNPLINVKIPKIKETIESKESLKIISIENFKRIIERFPVGSNFYVPLQIAFNTGMRAAEVCGLTWDNIDLKNNIISVEKILYKKEKEWCFGTPKSYSSYRKIKIGSTLSEILKDHRKYQLHNKEVYKEYYTDSNFVCTRENGTNITPGSFIYLSKVINFELHINFTFHSLRHTHATLLLEEGSNIKDIQERLGHSKLSTTMEIYSHVTEKISRNTVSKFEDMIGNM